MGQKNFVVKNGVTTGNITLDGVNSYVTITDSSTNVWANLSIDGQNANIRVSNATAGFNYQFDNQGNTNFNITGTHYGNSATLVYNAETTTLVKGEVVKISGAQGNKVSVIRANAATEAASSQTIGVIMSNIASFGDGYMITDGALERLNTSAYTEGATIYLSDVAGQFTTTKPQAPNNLVVIGWVKRSHATAGSIYIKVDNGWEIDELHDVKITSVANGQILSYDSANSVWVNVPSVAGTNTQVQFNDAGNVGGNANLTFNKSTATLTTVSYVGTNGQLSDFLTAPNINNGTTAILIDSDANIRLRIANTANVVQFSNTQVNASTLQVLANSVTTPNVNNGNTRMLIDSNANLTFTIAGNANLVTMTSTQVLANTMDVVSNIIAASHQGNSLIVVQNAGNVTINKGQPVYVSGSAGGSSLQVKLANSALSDVVKVIGVAQQTLAANGYGYVVTEGLIANVDTSAFANGDMLYVSNVAGTYTTGATSNPVRVGWVQRANATTGSIYVGVDAKYTSIPELRLSYTPTTDSLTGGNLYFGNTTDISTYAIFKIFADGILISNADYTLSNSTTALFTTTQPIFANETWTLFCS